MGEINGLKRPEEVLLKFRLMVEDPDVVRPFLNAVDTDDDDGGKFRWCLEQLLDGGSEENREARS